MSAVQVLLIAMYLLCGLVILISGYVYKEARNRKKKGAQGDLPFTERRKDIDRRTSSET
jgi:hypothetical protein